MAEYETNSEEKEHNHNNDEDNENLLPQFDMEEPSEYDTIMKWAEKNIGENPNTRIELIEELKDMIFERGECEPHRTDDAFILRFLRARHFIVRMAHRLMVNYYQFREENPALFYNLDYKRLLEVGQSEFFSIPPYMDQDGRRILIVRFEKWDTAQFTTEELFQAIIFLIQTSVLEPRHQILGGVCIVDVGCLGAGHAWYLTPTTAKQLMAVAYSALPHRVQAVHIVNASKVFDYVFGMIKPFLSDFMKERIFIHPDMESLHQHISPKCLPKRFGGVHKDYIYNDWLTVLKDNDTLFVELASCGYEGCRDFVQNL